MTERTIMSGDGNARAPHELRRTIQGVLAGGGVLMAIMLLLAGTAAFFGWIRADTPGRLDLRTWLVLELIGGAAACALGGAVSRRIAGRYRGPAMLAAIVLCVGLLEAMAVLRYRDTVQVDAPVGLVLLAPVVAAAGVMLGGWRPRARFHRPRATGPTALLGELMRYATPVLALATATALALLGLPGLRQESQVQIAATALALDFTLSVPALVFFLLVRAKRAPWIAIIPTFIVGYVLAMATIPERHHAVLDVMRSVLVPAELVLVSYLVVVTRRAFKGVSGSEGDFATRFRAAARRVLGSRIPADILTTEIAILYHAFRWRRRSGALPGSFTVHREVGYLAILVGLLLVLVVETIALQALVTMWGAAATWILTGLSLYAIFWLVGDYRGLNARPTRITSTHLSLRVGVRWEAELPLDHIIGVDLVRGDEARPGRDTLVVALLGQPNVKLTLKEPAVVMGVYGMRSNAREIWMRVDRVEGFVQLLRRSIVAVETNERD